MSDNVTLFPPSTTMTPEQALHSALKRELKDVLIIGYDEDGDLIVRSSKMSRAEAAWLAHRAFLWAHKIVE